MKKTKLFLAVLCMSLMVLGMVSGASAGTIIITPGTLPQWTGLDNSNFDAEDISGIVGNVVDELYKQNVDDPSDSGPYAGSYSTEFFNTPGDPEEAVMTYLSGPYITETPLYLYVKDGSQDPAYYIFNLTGIWNGTDTIQLSGFWPNQGAISHIAIYGGNTPVPEPTTLLLLGSGLIGIVAFGKRAKKA